MPEMDDNQLIARGAADYCIDAAQRAPTRLDADDRSMALSLRQAQEQRPRHEVLAQAPSSAP